MSTTLPGAKPMATAPAPEIPRPPKAGSSLSPQALLSAAWEAVLKLNPKRMAKQPVMFVTELCAAFATLVALHSGLTGLAGAGFAAAIALWLWATVWFGNLGESLAEGRGKAQAAALRAARQEVPARKLAGNTRLSAASMVPSASLKVGDHLLVEAGELVPADGEAVEGVASVDESAITGESAPVIREAGGDFSSLTGGTKLLSDWLVMRVTAAPGASFLDRMISLVEGAKRGKTPNELALDLVLAGMSLILLLAVATLYPFSAHAAAMSGHGAPVSPVVLVALLVCLIPTTIAGLLPAIGIAGMDRVLQARVVANSGRAVEAAGDVTVLFLDKTGTITLGNRQARSFFPAPGLSEEALAEAAQLASLADETPEGRSIVVLAKERFGLRGPASLPPDAQAIAFSAATRLSGIDLGGRRLRKGAMDAAARFLAEAGGHLPPEVEAAAHQVARGGGTPLVVVEGARALGVVGLQDIVKGGLKERFAGFRAAGIRTIMVTGDNPLTAAAIAAEAGVDEFLAEATPEAKLARIRALQAEGHLVAMAGDGTNDAPALAQADVAVAMNSGTQAAKEAANMVDLDSNPTKLLEVVEVGKQLLMTRGALTTFSLANDVAKYFAILPAAFATTYPELRQLDLMHLNSPQSAVLSAVIFNALILLALVPLALKGVAYKPAPAEELLRRNLLIYGLGGVLLPFAGIKAIDVVLGALGLAN